MAAFYCRLCSVFHNNGEAVTLTVLCGTMTPRPCFHDHCKAMFTGIDENPAIVPQRTPAAAIPGLQRRRLS